MNECQRLWIRQWISQRVWLTNQVETARYWVYDLAEQPWKAQVTTLLLDNFPLAACAKWNCCFQLWRGWWHAERIERGLHGNSVCWAGWGHPVSSSLTSAKEMLQWNRRYARHRVTSWSAAPCKTWTLTYWHSSIGISYIKGLFLWSAGMVCERRIGNRVWYCK